MNVHEALEKVTSILETHRTRLAWLEEHVNNVRVENTQLKVFHIILLLFIIVVAVFGCGTPELCPGVRAPANIYSDYEVQPNTTIHGIAADVPNEHDTARLERQVASVTDCVRKVAWTDDIRQRCWGEFDYPQCRDLAGCAELKIVQNPRIALNGAQTLFDRAPDFDCSAKGLTKCYWRAGVQNGYQVVTTPNAEMIGRPLVRLMTGCRYPYQVKQLASCVDRSAQ